MSVLASFRVVLGLALLLSFGCGPHRITYVMPSHVDTPDVREERRTHAHGVGPLLVGGGGYFFLFQSMSPALIDYTGPVEVAAPASEPEPLQDP